MITDPVIDELHAIKDQLSREANHSVDELVRQMREEAKAAGRKHVSFESEKRVNPSPQKATAGN